MHIAYNEGNQRVQMGQFKLLHLNSIFSELFNIIFNFGAIYQRSGGAPNGKMNIRLKRPYPFAWGVLSQENIYKSSNHITLHNSQMASHMFQI